MSDVGCLEVMGLGQSSGFTIGEHTLLKFLSMKRNGSEKNLPQLPRRVNKSFY